MKTKRKLGFIGGSGLYDIKGLKKPMWKKLKTAWGSPSASRMATYGRATHTACMSTLRIARCFTTRELASVRLDGGPSPSRPHASRARLCIAQTSMIHYIMLQMQSH